MTASLFPFRLYLGRIYIDVRRSPRLWRWRFGVRRIKENV